MSIYRRGALYWWRRNLHCRSGAAVPVTVRISLRTACARLAKARAAAFELELNDMATMAADILRESPTREDLASVYHLAFKAQLDLIVVEQATTPHWVEAYIASNRLHAQLFTLIARSPRM